MNSGWTIGFIVLIIIVILIIGGLLMYTAGSSRRPNQLNALQLIDAKDYSVSELKNFLTPMECDRLRDLASRKGLEQSRVYGEGTDHLNLTTRISQQAWLDDRDDPVVATVSQKVAALVNLPVNNQESLQVARYLPGGKFEPHYDACDDHNDDCSGMNGLSGPRYATVLVYLNDNYTGGTTSFPKLGITVRPEKGKAILFYDVDPRTLQILDKSFHSGDPLINGEKWIANKWVHLKPWTGYTG
jgi:prolyl 4-hydroxylase